MSTDRPSRTSTTLIRDGLAEAESGVRVAVESWCWTGMTIGKIAIVHLPAPNRGTQKVELPQLWRSNKQRNPRMMFHVGRGTRSPTRTRSKPKHPDAKSLAAIERFRLAWSDNQR